MSHDETIGRRALLRRALVVIAAAPVMIPILSSCGGGEPSCSSALNAAQLATRGALHYSEHSPDTVRRCSACQLFVGTATACGTCTAIPGSINPAGSCDAFAARA